MWQLLILATDFKSLNQGIVVKTVNFEADKKNAAKLILYGNNWINRFSLLPQGKVQSFLDICVIYEETGLYFLKTRYYDPAIGRFMTLDDFAYLDPDHVNGLNLYAYCHNNPVMFFDPNGTMDWDAFWKHAVGTLMIVGLIAITLTGVGALGVALGSVLFGAGLGFATSVLGQGIGNLVSGKGFFEDFDAGSVIMSTFAGAAFATGWGGIFGAALIGAMANAGASAFQKRSWAQIGLSAVIGGISGAAGYGAGRLISNKVYMTDDIAFADLYRAAHLETWWGPAAWHAVRGSMDKYLPSIVTGLTRGLSKYLGNKGVSFL